MGSARETLSRRDYGRGRQRDPGAARGPDAERAREGAWWRRPESVIGILALMFITVGVVAAVIDRSSSDDTRVPSDTTASDTGQVEPPAIATTTTTTPTATTPSDPQTTTGNSGSGTAAAEARERTARAITRMIRAHWTLRAAGDAASLSRAYALYTGPLQAASSESDWIAGIQRDGDMSMTIHSVDVGRVRAGSARAVVSLTTRSTVSGCTRWTMRYVVVRNGGRWLMSESTADPAAC